MELDYPMIPGNTDSEQLVETSNNKGEVKPKQSKNLWKWFLADPCNRYPVIIFILIFILSLIFLIVYPFDEESAMYGCGVVVLLLSAYGAYHFKILIALKQEVDKFQKLNASFKRTHARLKTEVNKLQHANTELESTATRLQACNLKGTENLNKFREVNKHLGTFADKNIEGIKEATEFARRMQEAWTQQRVKHERSILNEVFDAMEYKDDKENMSSHEFNEFLQALPASYSRRLRKKTFTQLAGSDGMLDIEEFRQMLDDYATEIAAGET